MSQNYYYPPGGSGSSNPSVGTNGLTAPVSSTLVAGKNGSGNLTPLSTDNSGYLNVNAVSSALPTGAATSANQVTEIAELSAISDQLPTTLGQKTSANSLAIVVASDQSAFPVSQSGTWDITDISGTISLPTGASTSALQTQISDQLPALLGSNVIADSLTVNIASDQTVPVSGSMTVSGTVDATQSGVWDITDITGTVSLPTGASTSALQTQISAQIPTTLGAKTTANSLAVNIASDQTLTSKVGGKSSVGLVRNDYTSVNVTTSAYVQLIASTASAVSEIFIFDSSGQTLVLATGAAASEVNQIYIVPGGNGTVPLTIASGTRVSIKAVSATASAGEIDINLFG